MVSRTFFEGVSAADDPKSSWCRVLQGLKSVQKCSKHPLLSVSIYKIFWNRQKNTLSMISTIYYSLMSTERPFMAPVDVALNGSDMTSLNHLA